MLEVNRLADGDLPALVGLHRQFWGEESALEQMRATLRRLDDDPDYVFPAARRDGALVGSVMGVFCEGLYGDCRPFMVVEDFVVDETCRRAGVGSALLCELERRAAERDSSSILLLTDADRVDAVRFYGSLGYECDPYRGFKKRLPHAAGVERRTDA